MVKQFNKAKISITLDQDVFDRISQLADEDDRSVSSMINKVLREYLKVEDKQGD